MRLRDFAILLIGVAAVYLPLSFFPAPDVHIFLIPWLRHIEVAGTIGAFAHPFSNYSPPYLYLLSLFSLLGLPDLWTIKLLSIASVGWLAWCVSRLIARMGAAPLRGAALTLLLPTVVLNGPVLGQCDSIWVGCCILAVAEAINDRPNRMALWAGVAFAFKAQAAFIAPFCIGYAIRRRVWATLAIPPVAYLTAIAPAAIVGWPILDLLTIYIRQPQFSFIGDAPNLWALPAALGIVSPSVFLLGYMLGIVAAVIAAIIATRSRNLLLAALFSAIIIPFFLPKMLERFFFLADVLSFTLAYSRRGRANIATAVLVQAGSFLSIIAYLLGWLWLNAVASLFMASAVGIVSCVLAIEERQPSLDIHLDAAQVE